MHRITSITPPAALEQRDGGASVDTGKEPLDPWALAWLLAEIAAGGLVLGLIAILVSACYTNWQLIRVAMGG